MPASLAPSIQIPTAFRGFFVSQEALADADEQQLELGEADIAGERQGGPSTLIGVAAAASRLGVHENTVRNWSDRGILRAVRLPGGHRRIDSSQVERVRSEIFQTGHRQPDDDVTPTQRHISGPFPQGTPEEGW
jgi:excisionase family DNA binding protein